MIWNVSFKIKGEIKTTKKSEFRTFFEAKSFVDKFIENYNFECNEKVFVTVKTLDNLKTHELIYHEDGEFECNIRDISKKKIKNKQIKQLRKSRENLRDFQRKKVYDWEEKVFSKYGFFESKMSSEEVVFFINDLLKNENAPELDIHIKKGIGHCFFKYYLDGSHSPSLTLKEKWGLNKFIICHELAHYFIHLLKDIKEGAHSESFMGVYIYLLSKYIKINEEQLWRSAIKNGVKLTKYPKNEYKNLIN